MTERIQKFLQKLDAKTRRSLKKRMEQVRRSPWEAHGVKRLQGYASPTFRIRVGKIRIIYQVIDSTMEIIDIDYRGNIY